MFGDAVVRGSQSYASLAENREIMAAVNNSSVQQRKSNTRIKLFGKATNTSEHSTKFKSAKPYLKKAIYGMYNCSIDESVDSLKDYLSNELNISVVSCFETNTTELNRSRKSFRVCIDAKDNPILLKSENWASGIIIKAWRFSSDTRLGGRRPTAPPIPSDAAATATAGLAAVTCPVVDAATVSSSPVNARASAMEQSASGGPVIGDHDQSISASLSSHDGGE